MKKLAALLVVIALFLGGTAVCSAADPTTTQDTLTFAIDREPVSLDPIDVTVNVKGMLQSCIYDKLLAFDENLNIVPCLAESWKQLDDQTWQFNLRKGVKFHDGTEVKSSDVLFSFRRLVGKGSTVTKYYNMFDMESSSCPDDYTFILKMKRPFAFVEARLATSSACILPEKAVTEKGADFARHPVGSGPYKFVSWSAGDRITLERNDNYWGHKSILKTIVVRVITESSSRTIDLESGGLDMTLSLSNNDVSRVAENPDLVVDVRPSHSLRYIGFNCDKKALKDLRVRQALNYATDASTLRTILYGEKTSGEALSVVPSTLKGFNPNVRQYPYDPEKAKQLLKEAGYEKGLEVEFMYLANSTNNMLAELLQQMWGEVGVTLKLRPTESGALSTALNKGEQEICCAGTTYGLGEAGDGLNNMFNSASKGTSADRTNLSDPELDKILNEIVITTDSDKRAGLVMKAQERIAELAPTVNLSNQYSLIGSKKNFKGLKLAAPGEYEFTYCYFE